MRFVEFKDIEKKPLLEYDANITDQDLKDLIVQRLQSEDDRSHCVRKAPSVRRQADR